MLRACAMSDHTSEGIFSCLFGRVEDKKPVTMNWLVKLAKDYDFHIGNAMSQELYQKYCDHSDIEDGACMSCGKV